MVYIAEAHSVDGWQTESNEDEGIRVRQHQSLQDRIDAARACDEALGLGIPVLVDEMDNRACEAFSAWPERIYIITVDGHIGYRGEPGPWGFDPDEAAAALEKQLDGG